MKQAEDIYPLSPLQRGLLFQGLFGQGTGVYCDQLRFHLQGELDVDALAAAWQQVVDHHPALRTSFHWQGLDKPVQVVHPRVSVPLKCLDWQEKSAADQERDLAAFLEEDARLGYAFDQAPLMRLILFRFGPGRHELLWSHHHLLLDGWCLPILCRQVFDNYAALTRGRAPVLPPSRPYREYIAWLEGRDRPSAERFWRGLLSDFDTPTPLGLDLPTPAEDEPPSFDERRVSLETGPLDDFVRRQGLTLSTLTQGAWAILLARYSGDRDVVFGSVVSGRPPEIPGVESMIGLFVNTLPVRARVDLGAASSAWLRQFQSQLVEMRDYEHSPLYEVQGCSGVTSGQPLFHTLFAFENYPLGSATGGSGDEPQPDQSLKVGYDRVLERTQYPLMIIAEPGPTLSLRLVFDRRLMAGTTVERIAGQLRRLVIELAADGGRRLGEVPLFTAAQRRLLVSEWTDSAGDYPRSSTIADLFGEQVARRGDAIAVQCDDEQLTYDELDRRGDLLARRLLSLGVKPDSRVGVSVAPSLHLIEALLGILKAGGGYVPVDPDSPDERLAWQLRSAGLVAMVTDRYGETRLGGHGLAILNVDDPPTEEPPTIPLPRVFPKNLAFVLYTSGSTGIPKGIEICQRSVARLVRKTNYATLDERQTFLQLAPMEFDLSTFEIWGPLANGGRLVQPSTAPSLAEIGRSIRRHRVNTLWLTAGLFHLMVDEKPLELSPIRQLLAGGDVVSSEHARRLLKTFDGQLINGYGPAESTTFTTSHPIRASDLDLPTLPIGRALANTRVHVLDRDLRLAPVESAGELCTGGDGLARGYLGRPQRTAEYFVPDPFDDHPGERLYRSGDRARWLADGLLEFLGRGDRQVKVRGFRVEPGELETALEEHPGVARAAVVAPRAKASAERSLTAFWVASEQPVDDAALRAFLRDRLPKYLQPQRLVHLEELPFLPSGKVNRKELARRAVETGADSDDALAAPPATPVEEILTAIFADVLERERVGAEDDFFVLGGHSLLATQAVSRVRDALGVELDLRVFFTTPTAKALVAEITDLSGRQKTVLPPLEVMAPAAGEGEGGRPLSFAQQRLWFLDQLDPGSAAYNMPSAYRLGGPLHREALRRAFEVVTERHEALRTAFVAHHGRPRQVIQPPPTWSLPTVDLIALPAARRQAEAERQINREAGRPFDLAVGPLLRTTLFRFAEAEHVLAIVVHHIVADGWSMGVMMREVAALYSAYAGGEASPLADLPLQYADYAAWQRGWLKGEVLEREMAVWRRLLDGAPAALELPTDRPRPSVASWRGARQSVRLSSERRVALEAASRRGGVTLFMSLASCWATLLHRLSGQDDLCLGTPIAGRTHRELEDLIGFFANTLVLRAEMSQDPPFRKLQENLRDFALEAYAHQHLPFERLVEELVVERDMARAPLFQVLLALQDLPATHTAAGELSLETLPLESGTARFDLTLTLNRVSGGALLGELIYNTDLFDGTTLGRLWRQFERLLDAVSLNSELRLSELPLLGAAERQQVLLEWSGAEHPPTPGPSLEELLAESLRRGPDAAAVIADGEVVSYRELGRRAAAIAQRLGALGVEPGARVALLASRSTAAVAAVLGILEAGGVYVPCDPELPPARLAAMLEDAAPAVILRQSVVDGLPLGDARLLDLDAAMREPGAAEAVRSSVEDSEPAYVMFTSGSTGRPKGVILSRANLSHYLRSLATALAVGPGDRYFHTASFSFSSSVRQLLLPLSRGAAVVLAGDDERRDPLELWRSVGSHGATIVDLVPSLWGAVAAALARLGGAERAELPAARLRLWLSASEPLPREVAERWAEELGPRVKRVNMFGQTETTGIVALLPLAGRVSTCHVSTARARLPVGRAIDSCRLHILDPRLRPVPIGVVGEVYIGGATVGEGYLGPSSLSEERFLPDPFLGGSRKLYRTGDRGRFLADGNLELLGRWDQQVKVRGARVEPGEIEAALGAHPAVGEVAVRAFGSDGQEAQLVAYLGAGQGVLENGGPTTEELRRHLRNRLPESMIPASFVWLPRLPRTASGKVDGQALPAPQGARPRLAAAYVPPRTGEEERLVAIWQDGLGLDRVGVHDNFFVLGGHSLLATEVVARVRRELAVELSLRQLFEAPTIAEMALALRPAEGARDEPPAPRLVPRPADRGQPFPLTDVQEAYWLGRQGAFELGNVATQTYLEMDWPGLDIERFESAWRRLIDRHDMLRAIVLADGQQQVLAEVPPFRIEVVDLRQAGPEAVAQRLAAVREQLQQPLAADQWPLFRISAARLGDGRVRIHLGFDSLFVDGSSREILFRELLQIYDDPAVAFKPLAVTFRDYVLATTSQGETNAHRRARDYWLARLDSLPERPQLPLAADPSQLAQPRFVRRNNHLSPERWRRLQELATTAGLTPSGVLLAAYAEVLGAWSKSRHFTLNLTRFDRQPLHPQVGEILGDFTSLTLLEVDLDPQETFARRAERLQRRLWDDLDHSAVSGVWVMRQLARQRGTSRGGSMPVVFTSALNFPGMWERLPSSALSGELVYGVNQTSQVWIDQQVWEHSGSLQYNWDFVDELFPEHLVDQMFTAYGELLHDLTESAAWQRRVLPLVPADQLAVRAAANATAGPEVGGRLESLFAQQAGHCGDRVAVLSPDGALSYGELERRAGRLSQWLRRQGVGRERLVAVVMDKGPEQVVAVLGILGAGAAYLPIDAELPDQRLAALLARGEVDLVLTQPRPAQRLSWPEGVAVQILDADWPGPELAATGADEAGTADAAPHTDEDLAYVIFTSGSTGVPKGVMIEHRAAVNTIVDINRRFGVTAEDRVLSLSALGFDLSVYDVFGSLAVGATLVLPRAAERRDPLHWARWMERGRVTVWNSVPALLVLLLESARGKSDWASELRLVMLSGDWIPLSLPGELQRRAPASELVSLGGATEGAIWSIFHPVTELDPGWPSVPYGRPLTHQRFHVLNDRGAPCPDWAVGELHIAGRGLARGYWRNEGETTHRFVDHPWLGERLYRTGDLGRYRPGGVIELLGREDHQVKIQGVRIELGEVEAAVLKHPEVKAAAVVAVGDPRGERRLAAFVVGEPAPPSSELEAFLRQRLPSAMVPGALRSLDRLPLTANGKIDRSELAKLATDMAEAPPAVGALPATASEAAPAGREKSIFERVRGVVEEVLERHGLDGEGLGPDTNLYHLGASSVDLVRIINRLEDELGERPDLGPFLESPVVGAVAAFYERLASVGGPPRPAPTVAATSPPIAVIRDPDDRQQFKHAQRGLRRFPEEASSLQLAGNAAGESRRLFAERRTQRSYSASALAAERLGALLDCLRQDSEHAGEHAGEQADEQAREPSYLYPSAGSLYPLQTYVEVRRDRLKGLAAGLYYHDPRNHRLVLVMADWEAARLAYGPVNRQAAEGAAFALFLVGHLPAIEPMYGPLGRDFCLIEAGAMTQLLMSSAPSQGIGLCPIGAMDFRETHLQLGLSDEDFLCHSLLGGPLEDSGDLDEGAI